MGARLRLTCAWCDTGSEHDGRRHGNGDAAAAVPHAEGDGSAHGGNAAYAPQDEPTAGATGKGERKSLDPAKVWTAGGVPVLSIIYKPQWRRCLL